MPPSRRRHARGLPALPRTHGDRGPAVSRATGAGPETERYRALVLVLAFGGVRFGEATALRRSDVLPGGREWHDEDLVFAQPNGRPIDKKADYDDWTRLLQQAGVRHVRLHDGRQTAATLLLS